MEKLFYHGYFFLKSAKNNTGPARVVLRKDPGFSLIELLVAISIIGILVGLFTLNLGGQRTDRNLNIAQNELVTNLRKAQSYTLSSRQVAGSQSGQVFILKFNAASSTSYTFQAIYNIFATPTPPSLVDVETYRLPDGVQLATPNPVTINRNVLPTSLAAPCSLVAFKAPYAKVYLNSGCNVTDPAFQPGDDYQSLLNYVVNVDGASYHTSTDSSAVIQLTDKTNTKTRKVLVRGATGVVCPTLDGVNCSN